MLKVSFRKEPNSEVKEVVRYHDGKVTIVSYRGIVLLPRFLYRDFPLTIWQWVDRCRNVMADVTIDSMYLIASGKAKRAEGDVDNPVFAERIAEARAKIHLYKFMRDFCQKLIDHYISEVFGKVSTSILNPDDNTLYGALSKYRLLLERENAHLKELLAHESDTEGSPEH